MANNYVRLSWGPLVTVSHTNLDNLASTNIWGSAQQTIGVSGDLLELYLQVWYRLKLAAAPAADDTFIWRISWEDADGTDPIRPGGVLTTDTEYATAATRANIRAALPPAYAHPVLNTSQDTTLSGYFEVPIRGNKFTLLLEAYGHGLITGNIVRYRATLPVATET